MLLMLLLVVPFFASRGEMTAPAFRLAEVLLQPARANWLTLPTSGSRGGEHANPEVVIVVFDEAFSSRGRPRCMPAPYRSPDYYFWFGVLPCLQSGPGYYYV